MSRCGPCPELGLGVPLSARSACRAAKERGLEGRGSARGEPRGDNAEGSALVGMSWCPDGCSSSPPLLQERFQMAKREAAASLEEAQKVQGRRRPVLAGSGRGVPVLGPCTPAATGSGRAGEDFGIWRLRWRGLWRSPSLLAMPVLHRGPWCGSAGTAVWLWGRGWDE